jgi:hypothetical protein
MFDSAHGKLAYKCVLANIIGKIMILHCRGAAYLHEGLSRVVIVQTERNDKKT